MNLVESEAVTVTDGAYPAWACRPPDDGHVTIRIGSSSISLRDPCEPANP